MKATSSNAPSWLNFAQRPREQGGLGLAPHQAAGLVGNLVHESGQDLNPWGPSGDNGTAWGTAQWRLDRLDRLKKRPDYQTVEGQQAFMREEFDTTERKAWQALQAATTPEEAATAVNRFYERSADNTGNRERAARELMAQFGGDTSSAPGALTSSYAPTEKKRDMPALSADAALGPGALGSDYAGGDHIAQALIGIGASLAGISNPDQAKVLTAQAASMQKQGVDRGTWSVQTLPDGTSFYFNNKTAQRVPLGKFSKPETTAGEDEAAKQAARSAREQFDGMAKAGESARAQMGTLSEARKLVEDPTVQQGPIEGNLIPLNEVLGREGAAKQANLQRISRSMELDLASRMKGSVSDYERKLAAQAQGFGPTQGREANLMAIKAYDELAAYQDAKAAHYLKVGGGKPIGDAWAGEEANFTKQWQADRQKAAPQEAAKPAQAAKPTGNSFKTKSGVTWSY